jgi:cytochrome c556
MNHLTRFALSAAIAAAAIPAMAQFQKPEDAVKYRQSAFSVMGAHFGRVGAMATGKVPFDAKAVQDNMAIVETVSKLPWAGFAPNTENLKSKAKPEVWMDKAKFDQGSEKMMAAVAKLNAEAKTGNLDAVKKAFADAGATCKACHDNFKE